MAETPERITVREFHVSRAARDRYQFDDTLFTLRGNVVFPNFTAARLFAQRINQKRDLASYPEQAVRAGQINALGLIDEILHLVVDAYRKRVNPNVMRDALAAISQRLGPSAVEPTLRRFVDEFPTVPVYRRNLDAGAYLNESTGGMPNREVALEEMLMLWLANVNPACGPFLELFDDLHLERETSYLQVITALNDFFRSQPGFGPGNRTLVDLLRAPALASPHSLSGQLAFILEQWGELLGPELTRLLYRLLSSLDLIKEEEKPVFFGPGPAKVPVYEYRGHEGEPERYSPDLDWMPNVVMLAKSTFVWLDQLSRKYARAITRLDQIPDEELDLIGQWGFTGLWLIGIWERSRASQRIKQMTGNPDAVASAYSLLDYAIADELGGEEAFEKLRERAWRRGIRLASDMVPNHMGIDSRWVVEHPDWFIALDYSPFPSYSFNGPNLSWDQRVGIYLEDHYYNRTDAAVVFRRVDHWTGSEKYIYHGNDGTSFPWNDTAQLNYLKPEVREAVIQTILHVARKTPIIRFDAAMTLTKRHFQRLWFPEPGTGGAIPSRAENGLTKAQFDARMPEEFWREVVDRIAAEAPDTLLLAEAFWLLEGYFVRTLGMHRVYNSAFMVMLRDEDNAKYRSVIKNTVEFDPEILKRYVNFMNNPDERTAVDQFGKDDKYFGVATMMATMPGLPMFGHGQIEGFTERYGMDFRRPLWDETADQGLIERHKREIFPLLRKRYLFAGSENFRLYDFFSNDGTVNEDVFAYSNRAGDERGLVIYHNRFGEARGWIRTSAATLVKAGEGDARKLVQFNLGEGLGLHNEPGYYTVFCDQVAGLEYIRPSRELFDKGLYAELGAYKYHVFTELREVNERDGLPYAQVTELLNGRGAPSVQDALRELALAPVLTPFQKLVNADLYHRLRQERVSKPARPRPATKTAAKRARKTAAEPTAVDAAEQHYIELVTAIAEFSGVEADAAALAREMRTRLEAVLQLPMLAAQYKLPRTSRFKAASEYLQSGLEGDASWNTLLSWVFVSRLGKILGDAEYEQISAGWIDEWQFGKKIAAALQAEGVDAGAAARAVTVVKILTSHQGWAERADRAAEDGREHALLETWLRDPDVQRLIGVNRFGGVLWFNQESFDELVRWLVVEAVATLIAEKPSPDDVAARLLEEYDLAQTLSVAATASGYQVEKLLAGAKPPEEVVTPPTARKRVRATRDRL